MSGTAASTGPHVISVSQLNGTEIVVTAFANGTRDCWGIADMTSSSVTITLGGTTYTGPKTVYFVWKAGGSANCVASKFRTGGANVASVTGSSTNGFSSLSG